MQLSPLTLALIVAALPGFTGCTLSQSGRVVVPPHVYQYATKSNRDIIGDLTTDEAWEVLQELHRIEVTEGDPTPDDYDLLVATEDNPRQLQLQSKANKDDDGSFTPIRSIPRVSALKSGHYFSTMTAIAIEEGLEPTAIPALVVGYRPEFNGNNWLSKRLSGTGIGFDLVVGGALNSLNSGSDNDSDLELAVGAGFTIPWSDSGAISIGAVTWREESMTAGGAFSEETEIAAYIGISLGSFNVEPAQQ